MILPRRAAAAAILGALCASIGAERVLSASGSVDTVPHPAPVFRVLAFFTAKEDQAHISFVNEAVRWFPHVAARHNFDFDTTSDWSKLNQAVLSRYEKG